MHAELDGYDRKILALLQEDASLSSAQIAEQVGLSQSPCWRRIQRMKEEGIIRGQVTLLDRKKIGLNTQIFAEIKLNAHGRSNFTEFTEAIRGFPEVLECYVLMGRWISCCGSSRRTSRLMSASSLRSCRWCRGFRR